jgi:hypothetical protein
MKKQSIFKCALIALMGCGPLMAANPFEECSRELVTYFPELLMNETLKKFHVPEDKWASINKELADKDKNIIKEVELRAEKMSENPLKDPTQRQEAVKLFMNTLFEAFSDTLHKNGISDDKQIQAMLEDLQQQKARKFAACLTRHKANSAKTEKNKNPDVPKIKDANLHAEATSLSKAGNKTLKKPDNDFDKIADDEKWDEEEETQED